MKASLDLTNRVPVLKIRKEDGDTAAVFLSVDSFYDDDEGNRHKVNTFVGIDRNILSTIRTLCDIALEETDEPAAGTEVPAAEEASTPEGPRKARSAPQRRRGR